jgi:hypothetical protein
MIMNRDINHLHGLAELARAGDARALAQLRQELEPGLEVVVRRAMRAKSDILPITQQIRASAEKFLPSPRGSTLPPRAGRLDRVVRGVCQMILGRLRANYAPTFRLQDTVSV